MTRLPGLGIACLVLTLAACGGGDGGGSGADAGPQLENPGFAKPDQPVVAYTEENGQWMEVGPADFSCLGAPTEDQATTVDIALSGDVLDFQNGSKLPGAMVTAYDGTDFSASGVAMATADQDGAYQMTLPSGGVRWAFEVKAEDQLDTYLLNQYLEPDVAQQSLDIDSVSLLTAESLPAFIGVTRTPGLGIIAAAIRDCNENEVQGAIATVSSVSGEAEHLEGAETYYFSAESTSLPVKHNLVPSTNTDGLFVVIELPVASEAYLQVWGYPDQAAVEADELTLLAEIPSPILADSVVTASLDPLRSE